MATAPIQFRQHTKIFDSLTDEQRQAIREKVSELHDNGVARKDIHEAVKDMLQSYGVDVPDGFKMRPRVGRAAHFMYGINEQLTEAQRTEIRQKMDQLRESGASRGEIKEAIKETLKSYGVDIPEKDFRGKREGRFGHGGFMRDSRLTDEQKSAIKQKISELKEQGADRQTIKTTVREMLQSYGLEKPERDGEFKSGRSHGRGAHGLMQDLDLTDEQRTAIREKVHELRELDADRQDIHVTINQMLESYGVEIPEEYKQRQLIMESLNDEQRKEIRIKIREMRKEGAGREDIHEVVQKMIDEFTENENMEYRTDDSVNESTNENLSVTNFPNPFNPETTIRYELKRPANVKVNIYNYQGQLVRELENKYLDTGSYSLTWDGHNNAGQMSPSGVYFLRINAGGETFSHRLILTK